MKPLRQLKGKRFHKLLVLNIGDRMNGRQYWWCLCNCGTRKQIQQHHLVTNNTKSCGGCTVSSNRTHNMTRTKTYNSWIGMNQRCSNPNKDHYDRYGGRGIKVCERWRKFEYFLEDMGLKPNNMTLERIDNDKDYSKENCRWATKLDQANNRSSNRMLKAFGKIQSMASWARELDVKYSHLQEVLEIKSFAVFMAERACLC